MIMELHGFRADLLILVSSPSALQVFPRVYLIEGSSARPTSVAALMRILDSDALLLLTKNQAVQQSLGS